jgi:actin-like ATPase involved in cell morphogenesis
MADEKSRLDNAFEAEVSKVLEYVKSNSNTYGEALQLANKLYATANNKIETFIAEEVRERLNNEILAVPIKKEAAAATTAIDYKELASNIEITLTLDGKQIAKLLYPGMRSSC